MIVRIGTNIKNLSVNEVLISYDFQDVESEYLHVFRCVFCNTILFQYKGKVLYVREGSSPFALPVIHKCKGCKQFYSVVHLF